MGPFFNEAEAAAYKKARDAWKKAERAALESQRPGSESLRQIREELTCGCGQKRLLTVSLTIGNGPDRGDNGIAIGGADAVDRRDGALQGEVQNCCSGFEAQDAVFDVVHSRLHVRVADVEAKARAESGEGVQPPRPGYTGQTKAWARACKDLCRDLTSGPILDVSDIPFAALDQLTKRAGEGWPKSARIGLIRATADLASSLRMAAEENYQLSHQRGTDAVAMAASDMAEQFSEAADEAIEALLRLIAADEFARLDMDEIEAQLADAQGVA